MPRQAVRRITVSLTASTGLGTNLRSACAGRGRPGLTWTSPLRQEAMTVSRRMLQARPLVGRAGLPPVLQLLLTLGASTGSSGKAATIAAMDVGKLLQTFTRSSQLGSNLHTSTHRPPLSAIAA